jgi:hypothetical protein
VSGIYHVEITQADNDRLRVSLTVGAFPDNISSALGRDDEGVQISVLVSTQANPPLLNVELVALRRAEQLIQDQIRGLVAAIEG